jgi:hypothetical protein
MEDQQKKLWQKPEVIIIATNHDINGGANLINHEGNTNGFGSFQITFPSGAVGTVGSATFKNAHS